MTGRRDCEISWQAAHRAETSSGPRSCISSTKTAMPRPVSAAIPPRSPSSSTRSISMSPESARPVTAGTPMPGFQRSRSLAAPARPPAGSRWANALTTPSAWSPAPPAGPSSRTAWCTADASGRRSDWSGRASSLPVPQPGPHRGRPQRVEQHGLADAAQPGEHDRALGAAAGDPLEHDVERVELLVAAGELGRALAGAGGVGVPDRVHDRRVYASLACTAYIRIEPHRRVAPPGPRHRRVRRRVRRRRRDRPLGHPRGVARRV